MLINLNELSEVLETAIDNQGLAQVIKEISQICYEKASHVRENWQDESLARVWEKNAKLLDKVKILSTF